MYGTVARIRVKPGMDDKLRQLSSEQDAAGWMPGFVFEHIYQMDANRNEYMMVVAFESREAYLANANSPEQHARYEAFRALLAAEPEWHDGEIVHSFPS